MPLTTVEKTPGPQYYPTMKPEVKLEPKFTFGFRRQNGNNALVN